VTTLVNPVNFLYNERYLMAHTTIYMTNGFEVKKAPVGFSWTTALFGGIPALCRQDWLWGICLILACAVTYGFAGVVMGFIYNKVYIKALFAKGYRVDNLGGLSESALKLYLGYLELPNQQKL
jgi:hypothetical protein